MSVLFMAGIGLVLAVLWFAIIALLATYLVCGFLIHLYDRLSSWWVHRHLHRIDQINTGKRA